MNKPVHGASEEFVGPAGDPLHEQLPSCRGRADCVVGLGHRHPQRRQRLLGRQRRKLGRGHRSRCLSGFRRRTWRRTWPLGRPPSPRGWFCFRGGSGRCLFCAASAASGGLRSGPCGLCPCAGRLRARSRGHLCACARGLCAGSGGVCPGSSLLRSPVRLSRPLVRASIGHRSPQEFRGGPISGADPG